MGPARAPTGLVVGHFTDPEGHSIGVAGKRVVDRCGAVAGAPPPRLIPVTR